MKNDRKAIRFFSYAFSSRRLRVSAVLFESALENSSDSGTASGIGGETPGTGGRQYRYFSAPPLLERLEAKGFRIKHLELNTFEFLDVRGVFCEIPTRAPVSEVPAFQSLATTKVHHPKQAYAAPLTAGGKYLLHPIPPEIGGLAYLYDHLERRISRSAAGIEHERDKAPEPEIPDFESRCADVCRYLNALSTGYEVAQILIVDDWVFGILFSDEAGQNRTLSWDMAEYQRAIRLRQVQRADGERYRIMPVPPTAELSRHNASSDDPAEIFRVHCKAVTRWLNEQFAQGHVLRHLFITSDQDGYGVNGALFESPPF